MLSALLEGETLCERTYLKSPSLIKASFRDLDGLLYGDRKEAAEWSSSVTIRFLTFSFFRRALVVQ